ncbi:hypothetical protein [Halovenus salina]|uniref:Uncharacterized protein n=1 Tax=Halovenus salina TaxID=1510225 RepID=A0ABD5W3J1_9EURY
MTDNENHTHGRGQQSSTVRLSDAVTRRRVLGSVGAAGFTGLAGCIGGDDGDDGDDGEDGGDSSDGEDGGDSSDGGDTTEGGRPSTASLSGWLPPRRGRLLCSVTRR